MKEENINFILEELGLDESSEEEGFRAQNVKDVLGYIDDIPDFEGIGSLDKDALSQLYNAFFEREIYDEEAQGIPDWSPYAIPSGDIIDAMNGREPLDLEEYRDRNIPDDAVL